VPVLQPPYYVPFDLPSYAFRLAVALALPGLLSLACPSASSG